MGTSLRERGKAFQASAAKFDVIQCPHLLTSSGDEEEEGPWCYCQQDLESSTLIGCDNDLCPVLHSLSKCKLNFMVVCHACRYIFVND